MGTTPPAPDPPDTDARLGLVNGPYNGPPSPPPPYDESPQSPEPPEVETQQPTYQVYPTYRLYWSRWFILAVFSLLACHQV